MRLFRFVRPSLVMSAAVLALLCASPVRANTVSHFGFGGGYPDVSTLLDSTGIGSGNSGSELLGSAYIVPGVSGATTLTFEYRMDIGSFKPTFGFFRLIEVDGIDPVTQTQTWATQALTNATVVFDERVDPVGTIRSFDVDAGEELVFFIIPDNTMTNFLNNPGMFFPSQTSNSSKRSPLFSFSDANPGQLDQLLMFEAGTLTLLAWEDLTRTNGSDNDFNDIAITIMADYIIPVQEEEPQEPTPGAGPPGVPEPAGAVLMLTSVLAVAMRRRRRGA